MAFYHCTEKREGIVGVHCRKNKGDTPDLGGGRRGKGRGRVDFDSLVKAFGAVVWYTKKEFYD